MLSRFVLTEKYIITDAHECAGIKPETTKGFFLRFTNFFLGYLTFFVTAELKEF